MIQKKCNLTTINLPIKTNPSSNTMIREEQSSVIATHVNIIQAARNLYPKNDGDGAGFTIILVINNKKTEKERERGDLFY
jgi:hypothetical protein